MPKMRLPTPTKRQCLCAKERVSFCGVVYSKNSDYPLPGNSRSALPISGQKSPVDESSLLKARERVESRLRKQLETRLKDERHQQTLARAKEIASAEIRKRQEEWERNHHQADPEAEKLNPNQEQEPVLKNNAKLLQADADDTLSEMIVDDLNASDTWPSAEQQKSSDAGSRRAKPRVVASKGRKARPDPASTLGAAFSETDPSASSAATTIKTIPTTARFKVSAQKDDSEASAPQPDTAMMAQVLERYVQKPPSRALARILPTVAWLILVAGVVGAVLSWTTIGNVEASVGTTDLHLGPGSLPLGLLLGFAYLATGVLGFAFFWVTTMISRQLKDIRSLLMLRPDGAFRND